MEKSELKKILTPIQFRVTQKNGTEPPFRNEYWDNKKEGIYVDIVSGEALFSSIDKFSSGTGWPSFTKPLEKNNIIEKIDRTLFMKRTEVRSKNANSHLGHVFDDGPAPTGLRYCINSAALRFIPVEKLDKEGYGKYKNLFSKDVNKMNKIETATFGAGCFWGVEHILNNIKGVIETTAGYMGGSSKTATYNDVRTGETGHAEVVQIKYDPNIISYEKLLDYFWRLHDPTTLNRQGVDVGTQYRSVIFYHNEEQKNMAILSKKKFDEAGVFKNKAVTEISEASIFYDAEDYHQDYFEKNGGKVCHILRDK